MRKPITPDPEKDLVFYIPHEYSENNLSYHAVLLYSELLYTMYHCHGKDVILPSFSSNTIIPGSHAGLYSSLEHEQSDSDVAVLLNDLITNAEQKDILKSGIIKMNYCRHCRRYIYPYETDTRQEKRTMHVLRFMVAGSPDPLFLYIESLDLLHEASIIGLHMQDKNQCDEALMPITGERIKIVAMDNLHHARLFTEFHTMNKKKQQKPGKALDVYKGNHAKLIQDLKTYGAYEEALEHELTVRFCRHCGTSAEYHAVESFYVDPSSPRLKNILKNHTDILIIASAVPGSAMHSIATTFISKKKHSSDKQKKQAVSWFDPLLVTSALSFVLDRKLALFISTREEYPVVSDLFSLIHYLTERKIDIQRQLIITRRGRENVLQQGVSEFARLTTVLRFILDPLQMNQYTEKIHNMARFKHVWKNLFSGISEDTLEHAEFRVDFFIEKFLMTKLQFLIQKAQKSAVEVNVVSYVDAVADLLLQIERYVYPYLKNTNFHEDTYTMKVAYYFYTQMLRIIAPLSDDYDPATSEMPIYRADYVFDDEIAGYLYLPIIIDAVTEAKFILGVHKDYKTSVYLKTKDVHLRDSIEANQDYLSKVLFIDEIRFDIDSDMQKKSLRYEFDEHTVFLPVFDIWGAKQRQMGLQADILELNHKIVKKRKLLLDYEFLLKANRAIITKEEKGVTELFNKKQRLTRYVAILAELYTEEEKPYAETGI